MEVDAHRARLALCPVNAPDHHDTFEEPERPAAPLAVRRAVWLMLAGACVQALTTLRTVLDRSGVRDQTARLAREFKHRSLTGEELERATSQAYWFSVATGVVFVVLWLLVARLVATGRLLGRVLATLFAIVYTFTFAFSAVRSFGPGVLLGLLPALLGISVVYLLWRRPVTPWMEALGARRARSSTTRSLG